MALHPIADQPPRATRKRTGKDFACVNLHKCFKTLIVDMDVRWRMVVPIHLHDEPEEYGNRRHGSQLSRKLRNLRDLDGCFSFRSALASIWRMRSRVTENCWPTSSSV